MSSYQAIDFANYKGQFWASYESRLDGSWAPKIASVYTDVSGEDAILTTVGGVRDVKEWKGTRQTITPAAFKQTITNRVFEDNITVPINSYRRSGAALFNPKIQELASLMADHMMSLAVEVLTGSTLGFDGLALFSASHTGGSNLLTNSDVSTLDVAVAAAPTPDEMSAIIVDLTYYFYTLKNDQSVYVNKGANAFILVTSNPKVASSAKQSLNRDRLASGSASAAFALQAAGTTVEVVLDPSLGTSTSTAFYFARTDAPSKGVILLEEFAPEVETLGDGTEYATLNGSYFFGVKATRGAGPGLWQRIVKCTLS